MFLCFCWSAESYSLGSVHVVIFRFPKVGIAILLLEMTKQRFREVKKKGPSLSLFDPKLSPL